MKIQLLKTPQSEENFSSMHIFLKSVWGEKKKIFAFSQDEKIFHSFKKSLWSHDIEKLFPYVDASNEFSDLSPFVCSNNLNIVNQARILLVINTVLSLNNLSNINCDNIVFIFTDNELRNEQISLLKSENIEYLDKNEDKGGYNKHNESRRDFINNKYVNNDSIKENSELNMNSDYRKDNQKDNYQKDNYNYAKKYEKAIAIIKPSVLIKKQEFLLANYLLTKNINVQYISKKKLPIDTWRLFYKQFEDTDHFHDMCEYLASSTVCVCILEGEDVIKKSRLLIGDKDPKNCSPEQIRALFGESMRDNGIHISDSIEEYNRERNVLFGQYTRKN